MNIIRYHWVPERAKEQPIYDVTTSLVELASHSEDHHIGQYICFNLLSRSLEANEIDSDVPTTLFTDLIKYRTGI